MAGGCGRDTSIAAARRRNAGATANRSDFAHFRACSMGVAGFPAGSDFSDAAVSVGSAFGGSHGVTEVAEQRRAALDVQHRKHKRLMRLVALVFLITRSLEPREARSASRTDLRRLYFRIVSFSVAPCLRSSVFGGAAARRRLSVAALSLVLPVAQGRGVHPPDEREGSRDGEMGARLQPLRSVFERRAAPQTPTS